MSGHKITLRVPSVHIILCREIRGIVTRLRATLHGMARIVAVSGPRFLFSQVGGGVHCRSLYGGEPPRAYDAPERVRG